MKTIIKRLCLFIALGRFEDESPLMKTIIKRLCLFIVLGRFEDEPTCGRPLGMRLDKEGYLIVVDAYLGLFKVNVVTGM